jgi:hypothetical protein
MMDLRGQKCYNGSNHIRNAPALLQTAGGVSQRSECPVTTSILSDFPDLDNLRLCSKCRELKPGSDFYVNRNRRDGLTVICKACSAQTHKDNRERRNERARERARQKYAENPEFFREKSRQWRVENPDKVVECRRTHLENGGRESKRAYYRTERGKDVQRAYKSNRRARESNASVRVASDDIAAIRKAQTDKRGRLICWICGCPIIGDEPPPHLSDSPPMPPHLDHWVPLKHNGANHSGNLHYTHGICNLKKGTKQPSELGRLL